MRPLLPAAVLLVITAMAAGQDAGEKAKIEALIKHVEGLTDAKFVRNNTAYDAATAAKFLRGKWQRATNVKTADDFIREVATASGTSGRPYLIRHKDGTEQKSADYLRDVLKKMK